MKKLYPATRFVIGAVLEESASDFTDQTLILPPILGGVPTDAIIAKLEASAEKTGDRVNENELAIAMLTTGVVNIEDVIKYTKCFDGKINSTRASTLNRVKVNLFKNPSLYKPYPGQEKYAKWVGFKDRGEATNGSTYRIESDPANPEKVRFHKVNRGVAIAVNADVATVLSGEAYTEAGISTPTPIIAPEVPPQAQSATIDPPATPVTPVTPEPTIVPTPSVTVPTGGVEASAVDSKVNAQEAEAEAKKDAPAPSIVAPVTTNDVVAPEGVDITKQGVDQVKAETTQVTDTTEPAKLGDQSGVGTTTVATDELPNTDETSSGGTGMGAVKAIADSKKYQEQISDLEDRYKSGEKLKNKYNQNISDIFKKSKDIAIKNQTSGFADKLKVVMVDMKEKATVGKNAKLGMLLTGDPGTGKTSFIRSLADAVGLPLITIEAPHLTKEHLINIPFLVKEPFVPQGKEHISTAKDNDPDPTKESWTVENAESNIITEMIRARARKNTKYTDEYWLKKVQNSPIIDKAFDNNPTLLQTATVVRQFFSCIFFVDEFFRTDDPNVQNILRGIINGKVGDDKLPDDVYCIYAANMRQDSASSVSPIPTNMQFGRELGFDVAKADDWGKDYFNVRFTADIQQAKELKAKIDNGTRTQEELDAWNNSESTRNLAKTTVTFDPELTNAITGAVGADLGKFVDDGKGLRLSPRRLEQMVVSLNAIKDGLGKHDFINPLTINAFLRVQFRDYLTGNVNEELYKEVSDAVADNFGYPRTNEALHSSEWGELMKLQIAIKDSLGGLRQYPMVIAGEPGIGKTQILRRSLQEMAIPMIEIEAHTLSKASMIGMPISKAMTAEDLKLRNETTSDLDTYLKTSNSITKEAMDELIANSGIDTSLAQKYMSKLDYGRYTDFAPPALYRYIMYKYFTFKSDFIKYKKDTENGISENDRTGIAEPSGRYKVALFLDELTRVDDNSIFNALRLVLLESRFGDGNKLPEDMMIVGALNPTDSGENVRTLTDHMKDVLDIIPADAHWGQWYNWLLSHAREMYSEKVKRYNEVLAGGDKNGIPAEYVANEEFPLAISPHNFAEITAEVLEYIVKNHTTVDKLGDQPETLKRFPMIGTPSANFYWQSISASSKPLYHNPRNLATTFDQMISSAFSDNEIVVGDKTLDSKALLYQLLSSSDEDRDPNAIETLLRLFVDAYRIGYEVQMRKQLVDIQKAANNEYNATLEHFTQGLETNEVKTILEQVLTGKEVKSVVVPFLEHINKYGLTVEAIEDYAYAEYIANEGETIVADFNSIYENALKSLSAGGYIPLMRLMWLIVVNIDEKLKTFESGENKRVPLDMVSTIRDGLKKSLVRWYGNIFEPLFLDKTSIKTIMSDKGLAEKFTAPNIEFLKDRL